MLNMQDDHSLLICYDMTAYIDHLNKVKDERMAMAILKDDKDEIRRLEHNKDLDDHCRRYLAYVTPTGSML